MFPPCHPASCLSASLPCIAVSLSHFMSPFLFPSLRPRTLRARHQNLPLAEGTMREEHELGCLITGYPVSLPAIIPKTEVDGGATCTNASFPITPPRKDKRTARTTKTVSRGKDDKSLLASPRLSTCREKNAARPEPVRRTGKKRNWTKKRGGGEFGEFVAGTRQNQMQIFRIVAHFVRNVRRKCFFLNALDNVPTVTEKEVVLHLSNGRESRLREAGTRVSRLRGRGERKL
eukprot:739338-Rhodomonas_salina.1